MKKNHHEDKTKVLNVPKNNGSHNTKKISKQVGKKSLWAGKRMIGTIGKIILAICLILVIISSVVGTALTVFVMNYIETEGLDLSNAEIMSNSVIYGKNKNDEDIVLQKLKSGRRQEWVSIDKIPQHVQDAFVYTEDMRFMDHEGVDWKRTLVSFARMLASGDNSQGGGSTISQQLIKNLNGDFEESKRNPTVKIKEILGALQLERHNPKSAVLEAYLNCIDLGNGNVGIQAAAKYYFNKDVSKLTIAEGAALAASPKLPAKLNIKTSPDKNQDRRNYYTLKQLYENKRITEQEYEKAKVEPVKAYHWDDKKLLEQEGENKIYSWYVDNALRDVHRDLKTLPQYADMSNKQVWDLITSGGLRIYTPVDIEMQQYVEKFFLNDNNFYSRTISPYPPEGAMIIMDYNGYVKAVVGSRREKTTSLGTDRATNDPRSPGSTIKPLASYAQAVDTDLVYWSSLVKDEPKIKLNGSAKENWPNNYSKTYKGPVILADALKTSLNTIPVDLMMKLGIDSAYNFLKDSLHISSLGSQNDRFYNLTLGMNDKGLYLDELTAAYTIFGNNGKYNAQKYYTKVVDLTGRVLLDNQPKNEAVITADSAYIMNRMLSTVVNEAGGTGTAAKLNNGIEVVGKTGTSDEVNELSFVGLTPYYVSGIRFAYDQSDKKVTGRQRTLTNKVRSPHLVWKNIMTEILKGYESKKFEDTIQSNGVVQRSYCTQTGLIASGSCPSRKTGWYKESNVPPVCASHYPTRTPAPKTKPSTQQPTEPVEND